MRINTQMQQWCKERYTLEIHQNSPPLIFCFLHGVFSNKSCYIISMITVSIASLILPTKSKSNWIEHRAPCTRRRTNSSQSPMVIMAILTKLWLWLWLLTVDCCCCCCCCCGCRCCCCCWCCWCCCCCCCCSCSCYRSCCSCCCCCSCYRSCCSCCCCCCCCNCSLLLLFLLFVANLFMASVYSGQLHSGAAGQKKKRQTSEAAIKRNNCLKPFVYR